MRRASLALVAVAVAVASCGHAATPAPLANGAPPAKQRCPDAARFSSQYDRSPALEITACVWGRFDGPGWIVFYRPLKEHDPTIGVSFIRADGTLAGSTKLPDSGAFTSLDVRAVDLDGDGVDEVVAVDSWTEDPIPSTGKQVRVLRVADAQIVTVYDTSQMEEVDEDAKPRCTVSVSIARRRIVIEQRGTLCARPGIATLRLVGGDIVSDP